MPPPRIQLKPCRLKQSQQLSTPSSQSKRCYATTATATTPAPSPSQIQDSVGSIERYPPTKPPSLKPPDFRKSQLHRQYTSLLRSSPIMLVFQHNNLRASEFAAIRRELAVALRKVTAQQAKQNPVPSSGTDRAPENHSEAWTGDDPADQVRLQVIQAGVFGAALRIVEFYDPAIARRQAQQQEGQPLPTEGQSAVQPQRYGGIQAIHAHEQQATTMEHALSAEAYEATFAPSARDPATIASAPDSFNAQRARRSRQHLDTPLHALLSGPLAVLSFPSVSPAYLAAAIRILSPTTGRQSAFAAPKRKDQPGYYDQPVQSGLQKLLLLAARVEGRTMDVDGVRWVAGIDGGLDGLRAQLVHILTAGQAQIVRTLESATNGLWFTLESRRMDLEETSKDNKDQAT